MIALTVRYHVKPGKLEAVLAALRRMQPLVKANEPGCRIYQVSRSKEAENVVLLYEVYADEAALEAHRGMTHFKEIIEGEVTPMLEKRDREFYTVEIF